MSPTQKITVLLLIIWPGLIMAHYKTSEPGQFLASWFEPLGDEYCRETLVVLDLDETVLTTPPGQWLGHSAMFYSLLDSLVAKEPALNRREASDRIDVLLKAIYQRTPLALTDSSLPDVITSLKERGVKVIGMTSRGVGIKDVTLWQLQQSGIKFSSIGERWMNLSSSRQICLQDGVVFVSHGNRKGESLNLLLDEPSEYFENIRQIVMVDDKQKHLSDVSHSLGLRESKNRYDLVEVLCTYPDLRGSYDPELGWEQLQAFLRQWRTDVVISGLAANDPFTRSVLENVTSASQ